ncbi:MAG: hypothetical protein WC510_06890 [Candidatus Omnitrophota bacterium]
MRRLLFLLLEVTFLICLGVFFYSSRFHKTDSRLLERPGLISSQLRLFDPEIERGLIAYLIKRLDIHEGIFEIIDVVNMDTHGISGVDYILVTLKVPGGKICQVTMSKKSSPWARWEIDQSSFSAVELPKQNIVSASEKDSTELVYDIDASPKQLQEYYATHPDTVEKVGLAFFDEKTGKYILSFGSDGAAPRSVNLSLEPGKGKIIKFVPYMSSSTGSASYWKVDYPSEYSGPGYRSYLYRKIKGSE